jgi:hypothetical protein
LNPQRKLLLVLLLSQSMSELLLSIRLQVLRELRKYLQRLQSMKSLRYQLHGHHLMAMQQKVQKLLPM